jgi:hypothetical protein
MIIPSPVMSMIKVRKMKPIAGVRFSIFVIKSNK